MSQFIPTFAYEFNDENAPSLLPPLSFPIGAAHGSEIQYLFGPSDTPRFTADQRKLADAMVAYWTTFARTGQPSSLQTPVFGRFSANRDVMQSLEVPTPQPEADFAADHNCAFWDAARQ